MLAVHVGSFGRLIGAAEARAPTLTFLDAHCECTKGWLEPLLSQLAADRSAVPCPVIDGIDANTFHFAAGAAGKSIGMFGWDYTFGWYEIAANNPWKCLRCSLLILGILQYIIT